jgi:ubiquinone/menaquinone biosynthesis C-methylase UbiE
MSHAKAGACCSATEQEICCEPGAKAECCGTETSEGGCGCSLGEPRAAAAHEADIREAVRARYAAAATALADAQPASCGCEPGDIGLADRDGNEIFGGALYGSDDAADVPEAAVSSSLGCGVPTAVADLHEGETVLDLGSGGGADILISARRVGQTGKAIGLDMTDEMLSLARSNAAEAGVKNVEFVKGYLEQIPLADASVDVVIANCVINLAQDKHKVLAETARVLKPGGRIAVSDVIADTGMDEATKTDMAEWTGCLAGALTHEEFGQALAAAGLEDIKIRATHRVHEHAAAAIVRARKPGPDAGGGAAELQDTPD